MRRSMPTTQVAQRALPLVLAFGLLAACTSASAQRLAPVAQGFDRPVVITHAHDARLFVVEQGGMVQLVKDGEVQRVPFLDITDRVRAGGERGLLGLAFPTDHAATGRFYVYYTDRDGNSVLSRFALAGEPDRADAGSEEVLLRVEQPYANHNGGQLSFGPDGYLYLGLGDGGSGGDPLGAGQRLDTWLGKLLRLDVGTDEGYAVPADNPFVGVNGVRPEIWAYGLRNPWRFSFDRATGDLFIADVGQNAYEEINFQPADSQGGENYGWNTMEAEHCFEPARDCDTSGLVLPIFSYAHGPQWGSSITGGYRYRGEDVPTLQGAYVFGDFVSGRVWLLREDGGAWTAEALFDDRFSLSTFGEDAEGELYLADYGRGIVFQVRP
ncbi:MAG: PQQ-dependent sugar dehydrogenase [Trueperaceae bacterium]